MVAGGLPEWIAPIGQAMHFEPSRRAVQFAAQAVGVNVHLSAEQSKPVMPA
jgi:hemolysin-activating ACP:hemolysin acyltransferase